MAASSTVGRSRRDGVASARLRRALSIDRNSGAHLLRHGDPDRQHPVWLHHGSRLQSCIGPGSEAAGLAAGRGCFRSAGECLNPQRAILATFHYTLQDLALIPIFMALVSWGDTWFAFLSLVWVRYFGALSNTLYLVHRAFLVALENSASRALGISLALLGSLAFAVFMNRLVELPLVRLRRRLSEPPARLG